MSSTYNNAYNYYYVTALKKNINIRRRIIVTMYLKCVNGEQKTNITNENKFRTYENNYKQKKKFI